MPMEWLKISYHSIGVFIAFLILLVQSIFLIVKKDKAYPTYWLIGVFIGFTVMLFGYTIAYSVYHPLGAFHRYFTVFVVFGNACFTGFAYHFPRNIHPKESKIMIPFAFVLATLGYLHFVWNTIFMEKFYNFEAHFYSFDFGAQTALVILFLFLMPLVILIRKTIAFSEYKGRLNRWLRKPEGFKPIGYFVYKFTSFVVGFRKFLFPKGKEAEYTKTFALVVFLLIATAITNALNKSGILSYDIYALYYSNSTLLICFVMLMAYINSSGEPTTFMAKLVGISLVTVLLVLGYVSNLTLTLNETDYDNQRNSVIYANREFIIAGDYEKLPKEIMYVIKKPLDADLFDRTLELMFSRDPREFDSNKMKKGELVQRQLVLKETKTRLEKKYPELPEDELEEMTIEIFRSSRQYSNLQESLLGEKKRGYRTADQNYTSFDLVDKNYRYEVGFSYSIYRAHMHKVAGNLFLLAFFITVAVLIVFPRFFQSSLVKPLQTLLKGMHRVNRGDLNVAVSIKVNDEIGFISNSFNSMVKSIKEARQELRNYANTLEDKVEERTKEVQEKMEEVQALKVQQDGDYFLTSLLAKPLFINANKSALVPTEFLIKQKKKFEFRNRRAELGGDICITGNLKLGKPQKYKQYTMAMNGDAMGKSMQGAGGSLVMGVVMNSIMARSAANKKVLDMSPEQWMTEAYHECNSVFKSFNGTMVLSATVVLIEDRTGEMWYWNAEHPFTILYRDNKASFIEEDLQLRKLGLESEYPFQVFKYQLLAGDTLLIGSDGKDDLDLTPNEEIRTINDDENLILAIVEQTGCELSKIEEILLSKGNITDDLSILKLNFQHGEVEVPLEDEYNIVHKTEEMVALPEEDFTPPSYYERGKDLYISGKPTEALELLIQGFWKDKSDLRLCKLLGLVAFKEKDYENAVLGLKEYLYRKKENDELWYYLSIAYRRIGEISLSLEIANQVFERNAGNVKNLIHLSELHRQLKNEAISKDFANKALTIEPENSLAKQIMAFWNKEEV
jgi:HAMP domain-containing protein/tetratricopeptide (TPR) repeat protein